LQFNKGSKSWETKTEQTRLIDLLIGQPGLLENFAGSLTKDPHNTRLQRGRKFYMVVELFGTVALSAAPQVSVTRLDGVGIEVLRGLLNGTVSNDMVVAVQLKLAQV
jgi:hypothetical protein